MDYSTGEISKDHTSDAAVCNFEGSRPIKARRAYFCGLHKPMGCGNQGAPLEYRGMVSFTLYPCNALSESHQQPVQAEQTVTGGLELKLAPGSA